MGTERKMKECDLCVKRGTDCGLVAEGIKGCSGYIGATKEDRMLHSIFFEEEYFTRESRLIYYMEWLPRLKYLDELFTSESDLVEVFEVSEETAKQFTDLCGEIYGAVKEKLVRL